jgi:predicted N-acetyltransferase YhbS
MISIRKERPPDVAAREALLDDAFGGQRWRKSSQRLRDGRSPWRPIAATAGSARRWSAVPSA